MTAFKYETPALINNHFKSNSTSSGAYVRMYAAAGTGQWDIYNNGANLRFSDNASAGNIVMDRPLTMSGQNIIMSSGNGIDFSATANSSGTMTSELLSDYEEGSFTPSFGNGGNGTYANRLGRYTKIGNIVTVHVHIQLSSVGTASGNIQISGFPFTSNSVIYSGTSTLHGNSWNVTRNNLNGLVPPSSTSIDLYYNTGSSSVLIVQHSDVGTGNLLFTVSYQV